VDPLLSPFIREIQEQCCYALYAYDEACKGYELARSERMPGKDYATYVFYSVQTFLVAAACVSKILWPAPHYRRDQSFKDACLKRGVDLRDLFGIGDTSPIKSRALRDRIEHFYEDVQDWEVAGGRHNIFDKTLTGASFATRVVWDVNDDAGASPIGQWRSFRGPPGTLPTVELLGVVYPLAPLADALRELQVKIANFG
jgi:hypothetical protein